MADYVGEFFNPSFFLFETSDTPDLPYEGFIPTDLVTSHEMPDLQFEDDLPSPPIGFYEPWGSAGVTTYYMQRVYDTVLAVWCYYTKTFLDPAPAPGDTTPNHTGNLLAGSHTVVRTYTA